MTSIGKIVLMPRGTYDSSATYNHLDWVRYNSRAWVCKQDNVTNVTPTEGATWTVIAEDGTAGGWTNLANKPFETIGAGLGVNNNDELIFDTSTLANYYQTGDTAETDLADADKIPFYDDSASAKKNSTWSNIKSVLKTYFDTIYFAANKSPIEHKRSGITLTAGQTVRIPSSGTKATIKANRYTIPICDNGTGKAVKYTSMNVYDGYAEITLAEDISNATIGLIVFRYTDPD